jgi:PAS domain S-box-containing protein
MSQTYFYTDIFLLKGFISYIKYDCKEQFINQHIEFFETQEEDFFLEYKDLFVQQLDSFLDEVLNNEDIEEVLSRLQQRILNQKDDHVFFKNGLANFQMIRVLGKTLHVFVDQYTEVVAEKLQLVKELFHFFYELELRMVSSENFTTVWNGQKNKMPENLVNNSIDGILVFDEKLRIVEFNPAVEKITGLNRQYVLGKEVQEVLPHILQSGEIVFYHQVLEGKSITVPEVQFFVPETDKKGYYRSNCSPIISTNGVVSGGLVVIHEVTQRKLIEEKLREQKQFSESLINNSIDGVFTFDHQFLCTAWNAQMELVTGIEKKDALDSHVEDLLNKSVVFRIDTLSKVFDGEITYLEDFSFSNSNQKFEVFMMPVYNPEKIITGGLVIVHNITERTKAEEAIRELSESLKHTVEGIGMVNIDGKFISANKAAARIFSLTIKELQKKYWQELIDEEEYEQVYKALEKVKIENSASFEVALKKKDLGTTYVEVTLVPYNNKFGKLNGYHLFFRDISERKHVENRLKKSEALLIEAQELARLGSFEYDPINSKMSWSDEVFRIFGLKPKEIKPDLDAFYSLLSEDAREIMVSTWDKVLSTYKTSNFEHKIKVPGKPIRVVYGHAKPVINTDGNIVKISGYIQDITERKEAEKILKEAYEELKIAEENLVKINARLENRVKQRTEELLTKNEELKIKNEELLKINSDLDNFVYTASHDLKSPISNIEGLINTLTDELKLSKNEEYSVLIEMINISINKFKSTIKDLTEITKIQKDTAEDVSQLSVGELIEEVRYDIRHLISENLSKFHIELNVRFIQFSRKNLRSILYNLISNAVKYRSAERDSIVTITTERSGDYFLLKVKDNGLGIDLQQKDKIFRMFKRMHTHVEGTGIGLYIVKRIIENAGGRIEVESKVGRGTEFKVYLKMNY